MSQAREAANKIELTRWAYASLNSRDFDALMDIFGPDSVWDVSRWGLGIHVGTDAIRRFLGDWFETLAPYEVQIHEILDLGNGCNYPESLQLPRTAHEVATLGPPPGRIGGCRRSSGFPRPGRSGRSSTFPASGSARAEKHLAIERAIAMPEPPGRDTIADTVEGGACRSTAPEG